MKRPHSSLETDHVDEAQLHPYAPSTDLAICSIAEHGRTSKFGHCCRVCNIDLDTTRGLPFCRLVLAKMNDRYKPTNSDDHNKTHGSLGCFKEWHVRQVDTKNFLTYYAHAIRNDSAVCIDEKISADPVFRMFVDLDLLFSDLGLVEEYHLVDPQGRQRRCFRYLKECYEISRIVVESVSSCFPELLNATASRIPDDPHGETKMDALLGEWCLLAQYPTTDFNRLMSLVSMCAPKPYQDDQGRDLWKVGVHINWIGNIHCSRQMALDVRRVILDNLSEKLEHRKLSMGENGWESAVDAQVYSRGIRMIGSHKKINCEATECAAAKAKQLRAKATRGKKDAEDSSTYDRCKKCDGRGWSLEPRIYRPQWVLNGRGEIESGMNWLFDMNNVVNLVMACSLRTSAMDPDVHYVRHPSLVGVDTSHVPAGKSTYRQAPKKLANNDSVPKNGEGVFPDHPACKVLEELIRDNQMWETIRVSNMVRRSRNAYRLTMSGPCVRNCRWKGSTHKSNNIYFVYDQRYGLYQDCWDAECHAKLVEAMEHIAKAYSRKPTQKQVALSEALGAMKVESSDISQLLFDNVMNSSTKKILQGKRTPLSATSGNSEVDAMRAKLYDLEEQVKIKLKKYYRPEAMKAVADNVRTTRGGKGAGGRKLRTAASPAEQGDTEVSYERTTSF